MHINISIVQKLAKSISKANCLVTFLLLFAVCSSYLAIGQARSTSAANNRRVVPVRAIQDSADYYFNKIDAWVVADSFKNYQVFNKAQDILDSKLKQRTWDGRYWLYKALVEVAFENKAEADINFLKAKKLAPTDPDICYHYSKYLYNEKGEIRHAIGEVSKALSIKEKAHYWYLRAQLGVELEYRPEIYTFSRRAIALGDTSAKTMYFFSVQAHRENKADTLVKILEQRVKNHPREEWATDLLSLQYAMMLQFDKSCALIEKYNKDLKLYPVEGKEEKSCSFGAPDDDPFNQILRLLSEEGPKVFFQYMVHKAMVKYPDSIKVFMRKANWCVENEELDSGVKYFHIARGIAKTKEELADVYYQLGATYLKKRYYDSASKYTDLSIASGNKSALTFYFNCISHLNRGDLKSAEKSHKLGKKLVATEEAFFMDIILIDILQYKGKYKEALAVLKKHEDFLSTTRFLLIKANLEYILKQDDAACKSIRDAKKLDPELSLFQYLVELCKSRS